MESGLTDRKSRLSPARQALLAKRLSGGLRTDSFWQKIPRRKQEDPLSLSFGQQRLWLLQELDPGNTAYNISQVFTFSGPLDQSAVSRAVNTIVARHDALRTSFTVLDGRPVPLIKPFLILELPITDLTHFEPSPQAEMKRLAIEEARRAFDLSQSPLFRIHLFRLSEQEHALLLTVHHIVSDGWSLQLFFRELSLLYETFARNEGNPIAELPIQYADYAAWQRAWPESDGLEKQIGYWRKQLAATPVALDLPIDKPRPQRLSFNGAHQSLSLSKSLGEQMKALAREENATFFMALLAAFNVLLYRYTGTKDILVGSPIAGRNQIETESLIGTFVNTLAFRSDLSGDPTFREMLARTRETTLDGYANQDVPFERLVQELMPPRGLGHSPFFQVMLDVRARSENEAEDRAWRIENLEIDRGGARADLLLFVEERESSVDCWLEYSTDLFEPETISSMLGHFEVLLTGAVRQPDVRISQLPLLTELERSQLLEWSEPAEALSLDVSGTQPDTRGRPLTVHQLFERQVELTPDAVALVFADLELTYGELNRRANQLADNLRSLGVGSEALVGVCLERSVELVVSVLGILKAGGAYLPLDPSYPAQRLNFMVEDSGARMVLTQDHLREKFLARGAEVLIVGSYVEALEDINKDPTARVSSGAILETTSTGNNLAYVIYTSGSTGRPKGVQVTHQAVLNFLDSMRREPGITSADELLSVTTLSFDIAGLELYLPLTAGAQVNLVSAEVAADGRRLSEEINRSKVTMMQATPSTWRMLIEAGWPGKEGLRILCGGEALSRELAEQLLPRCAEFWNLYGPTETTIWSTCCKVEEDQQTIHVGRPIANTQTFILDGCLEMVPMGVPGELYIGGDGLARGYLNRSDLTAERFIPNQYSSKPGERLYKTGDRARHLVDGNLEILGRVDHQVKLRGFRIELGEIETALGHHPNVAQVIVMIREDRAGDQRLVAYLVPKEGSAPAVELRRYLQSLLPDYMVPSAFVQLEAIPLTPNKKVDRRALPPPDQIDLGPRVQTAPRDAIESQLAEIWSQVLGQARVGIHDDFFDLGGHSLLAMQVVSRITEAFRINLSLRYLFENATVAALAEFVRDAKRDDREQVPTIKRLKRA